MDYEKDNNIQSTWNNIYLEDIVSMLDEKNITTDQKNPVWNYMFNIFDISQEDKEPQQFREKWWSEIFIKEIRNKLEITEITYKDISRISYILNNLIGQSNLLKGIKGKELLSNIIHTNNYNEKIKIFIERELLNTYIDNSYVTKKDNIH